MLGTVYCGVDLHARMQTVSYINTEDGEIHLKELNHATDDVRGFYERLGEKVVVGLEASGYTMWFERMVEELGHEVWLGHASEIRRYAKRRQKNDRRDAELILDLMMKGDFPRIHRRSAESDDIIRMLRHRHSLVRMRTATVNHVQALAIGSGVSIRTRLLTPSGRKRIEGVPMPEMMAHQRSEWLKLLDSLREQIKGIEKWLGDKAKDDKDAQLLMTHPGIGVLTGLALVHTLKPVDRFSNQRKVVAYLGMDPMERSSAERKRYVGISKEGSRLVRFLLVEAGQVAARKGDDELKQLYVRLAFKRGRPKAKVAVGRKLGVRAYIMLRDGIDYAEFLRRGVEARLARKSHRR